MPAEFLVLVRNIDLTLNDCSARDESAARK